MQHRGLRAPTALSHYTLTAEGLVRRKAVVDLELRRGTKLGAPQQPVLVLQLQQQPVLTPVPHTTGTLMTIIIHSERQHDSAAPG